MTVFLLLLFTGSLLYLLLQLHQLRLLLTADHHVADRQTATAAASQACPTSLSPAVRAFAQLLPETEARRRRQSRELRACGYLHPEAWTVLQAMRSFLVTASLLTGLVLLQFADAAMSPVILAATAVIPLLAWSLPGWLISRIAQQRQTKLTAGLPDLLSLLQPGLQAGQSVSASLDRVSTPLKQLHPELAEQVQIVARRGDVVGWGTAVREWGETYPHSAIRDVSTLLSQSARLGTRLCDAVGQLGDQIDDQLTHQAEQTMQRVSVLLLFPTVLCLVPAVFLFLATPSILALEDFAKSGTPEAAAAAAQSDASPTPPLIIPLSGN